MGKEGLNAIATNMKKFQRRPEDWHDLLFGMSEEGARCLHNDDAAGSLIWYQCFSNVAVRARANSRLRHADIHGRYMGSATENSFLAMLTDLKLCEAEIHRQRIEDQLNDNFLPPKAFDDLRRYNQANRIAGQFSGMSDQQRMKFHYHEGYYYYYRLMSYKVDSENQAYAVATDPPDMYRYARD